MARTLYAGRPGDTVAALFNIGERLVYALPADANGDPTAVTLTVWDEPDGTQYTDLLAADGTTPITTVVVPPGTVQIPAFYGPDGVTDELWLRDPEGDYSRLDVGPPGVPGTPGADGEVTTAAMNTAIAAASTADRNRANHAGTQAASTITGLATVATSGAYSSLSGTPSLGTAASKNTGTGAGQIPILGGSPGTPNGTKFLRDDGTWAAAGGGSSGGALIARTYYNPASLTTLSTTSLSATDVDATNLAVTFTAPSSGRVQVVLQAVGVVGNAAYWSLRSGTTAVPGSWMPLSGGAITGSQARRVGCVVTGLTPGASYTYKWAYGIASAATHSIQVGGAEYTSTTGPAIMEVFAQ